MPPHSCDILLICSLLLLISNARAQTSSQPKALILPVLKDSKTLQYTTHIEQRTPLVPIKLTVDIGGQFLWMGDCDTDYVSSTYKAARCRSSTCKLARAKFCNICWAPPRPNCVNNTCTLLPDNTVTQQASRGGVSLDVLAIQSTNGSNPGKVVLVPDFIFACGYAFTLEGLASGVVGMLGLGSNKIAPPTQFATKFNFPKVFAVCLSPSLNSSGFVIFGPGPYVLPSTLIVTQYIDVSKRLFYTPLLSNPVSTASAYEEGEPSWEYFINVTGLMVDAVSVKLNTTLLSIDKNGYGGTKISSVNPYTVMERSIYEAFLKAFVKEMSGVPRVKSVAPFGACFNSTSISSGLLGPDVPNIEVVLHNNNSVWYMYGSDSMVQVSKDVLCLGFVDGGVNPRTSIVFGAHQFEDHLLQFDLEKKRLGYTDTLRFQLTSCSKFNFTSTTN